MLPLHENELLAFTGGTGACLDAAIRDVSSSASTAM
jgi:hypothetical protein